MKNNDQEARTETATKTEGLAVGEPQKATHWVLVAIILLFVCSMAFVMLTPQDVLQRYPQVVPYVDWMASWNPHVHSLGLRQISGPLADAQRFCAAVIWGVWTALMVLLFVVWFARDEPIKPFTNIWEIFLGLFVLPLIAFLIFFRPMYATPGRSLETILSARPLWIPGMAVFFWCLIFGTLILWRNALRRNFDF